MRWFFVWLVFCWLAGIVMGVTSAAWGVVWLAAAALLFWGWRYRLALPILVAGILVVPLGNFYGQTAKVELITTSCVQHEKSFEGTVLGMLRQDEDRSQYVVSVGRDCTILVTAPVWPRFRVGDRWRMEGNVEPLGGLPPEFLDYGEYLKRQGIGATMRYPNIVVLEEGKSWIFQLRRHLINKTNAIFREPEAAVVRGMVWGERGAVGEQTEQRLRAAGILHILAISGSHVSIILGGLLVITRFLRLPRRLELVLLLGLMWGYVLVAGMPASAARAGWFWTVFLIGWRSHMLVSWLAALLITLLMLVTWQPTILLDVGLQLSVAAVVGIMLANRVLDAHVKSSIARRLPVRGLSGALGALLMTGPISATVFGSVSWVGLVVNLLVLPVLPVLLGAAIGAVLLGMVWVPFGLLIRFVVRWAWWYVEQVSYLAILVPGGYIEGANISGDWLVWWYPLVLTGTLWWLKWRHKNWRVIWE